MSNLASFDAIKKIQTSLNERILKKVNRSIIFSDRQFMEWFNLTIGIDVLIKSGAFNVKEFDSIQVY